MDLNPILLFLALITWLFSAWTDFRERAIYSVFIYLSIIIGIIWICANHASYTMFDWIVMGMFLVITELGIFTKGTGEGDRVLYSAFAINPFYAAIAAFTVGICGLMGYLIYIDKKSKDPNAIPIKIPLATIFILALLVCIPVMNAPSPHICDFTSLNESTYYSYANCSKVVVVSETTINAPPENQLLK